MTISQRELERNLNAATAMALVVDREGIEDALASAAELEYATPTKGWTTGIEAFKTYGGMKYLLMIAQSKARMIEGAPVCVSCVDADELRKAIRAYPPEQDGDTQWFFFNQQATKDVVSKILADAREYTPITNTNGLH